ncbi:MAG: TAXI family TRAP transporter solute-binding subunit [Oscillospiraceae bacterium]|nr:TAXI family TRAP transporter solute-binding subunit [Oscillospiraceae bacterium]
MKKKHFVKLVAILVLVALLAACGGGGGTAGGGGGGGGAPDRHELTFAAGAIGGAWYMFGAAFSEVWESNIPGVRTTLVAGSGTGNPYTVNMGEAQIGFSYVHTTFDTRYGVGTAPAPDILTEDIRLLMNIHSIFYFTGMIDRGLGITNFEELLAAQPPLVAAVGAPGSGSEEVFRAVMEAHGITYADIESWGGRVEFLGAGAGADSFRDGHVNMLSNAAPQPFSTFVEVGASRDVTVLPISPSAIPALEARGYAVDYIDTTPYGDPTGRILSAGPVSIVFVHKDLDEELVYQMTRLLWEHMEAMIATQPALGGFIPERAAYAHIPLHPGAERFFREIGLID